MPAQTGELVHFIFEWSVAGVPTSGLSPAPLVTIYSPAGVALVSGAAMTEQATPARYIYDYTLPGTPGLYIARASSSQANLDVQYLECSVMVGQAWIQDLDATVSSRSTLDATGVRSATGLATANLDTQLAAIGAKTANIPAVPATEANVTAVGNAVATLNNLSATGVWEHIIEGAFNAEEVLRILGAAMAGKISGANTTTVIIRNISDTKTVITATVDAFGDRSVVTLDAS